MIIIARDNLNYLVKKDKRDNFCYLINLNLETMFGPDVPEKFQRFGTYEEITKKDISKFIIKKIDNIISGNINKKII